MAVSFKHRVADTILIEYNIPVRLRFIRHDDNTSVSAREFITNLRDHVVTSVRDVEGTQMPDDRRLIGQGLLWAGTPGSGKTYEAAATLQEVMYRSGNKIPVYFVAYADYIHERKEQWALNNKEGMADRWAQIQCMVEQVEEANVLMVDDVGKEMDGASGFAASELERLLRKRHREGRPTLVTTNLKPKDWAATFGSESLGDFIKEAFAVIAMTNSSRRGAPKPDPTANEPDISS
jgi:DNA replication protein DnaC